MKFFTESWHSRLATFYGPMERGYRDRKVDFCQYFWAAVKGLFAVLGILAATTIASIPVADFLAWVVFITLNGMIAPSELAIIFMGIVGVFLSVLIVAVVNVYLLRPIKSVVANKISTAIENDTPTKFSFLSTWYYSVKNKVCIPVTLKGIDS